MSMDRRQMGRYLPLRDAIDRLFEGSVIAPQMFGTMEAFPPVDLHVDDDNVIVHMSIPGAKPEDINISVTGDTVTISGEVRHNRQSSPEGQGQQQRRQTYYQEIWSGRFQRSFTLPIQVNADAANATFENGILTLTLPKSEATKPRKVQIGSSRTIEGEAGRQGGEAGQSNIQTERVPVSGGESS